MRAGHLVILLAALTGCGSSDGASDDVSAVAEDVAPTPVSITVSSSDFTQGATLALAHVYSGYGCVGSNRSPALSWTPVPGALGYAVTLFDPDAPGDGWWHWTVANIPATVTSLPAGAGGRRAMLPPGSIQGRTDFGSAGYGGPCPPVGDAPHHYVWTVTALGVATLPVDATTSGEAFTAAVEREAIATGTLTALYGR